jgi:hypothetical protein
MEVQKYHRPIPISQLPNKSYLITGLGHVKEPVDVPADHSRPEVAQHYSVHVHHRNYLEEKPFPQLSPRNGT